MANYLPAELGQNYIDYIMKQYQLWIDTIFGSENNNADEIAIDPAVFQGVTGIQFWGSYFGGSNFSAYGMFGIDISSNNNGNVITSYTPIYGNFSQTDMNKFNSWFNDSHIYCDMWGSYEMSQLINGKRYFRMVNYDSAEINANYHADFLDGVSSPFYAERPYIRQGISAHFDSNNNPVNFDGFLRPQSDGMLTLGTPVDSIVSFTNIPNVVNYDTTNNYYNTETYTTENGYTVTVYNTDTSINIGTQGIPVSYNDIFDIFNNVVLPSLPVALQDTIVIPTYDEIKYEDVGDFYIEPLHQYDIIPVAPAFDGTIDLADYPTVLAEGANTFLDFMPATLSALFTAAFVACVVIRKLGR